MKYWMFVERLENWKVDEAEGFRRFGIPDRKGRIASQIRKGDHLIFYVSSGISAFSDIREAMTDGTQALRFGGEYDTAFPISVATRPILVLPREKWVPIKLYLSKLSFTAGKKDWRQTMRNSVRQLECADGETLTHLIFNSARS